MNADEIADLKAVAPGVRLVECKSEQEAIAQVIDADASYAFLSPAVIRAGKSLRWVQQPSAGVEHLIEIPELLESDIVLTNMQRAYGPEIADQAIGYLLCLHPQPDALRAHAVERRLASERPRNRPR